MIAQHSLKPSHRKLEQEIKDNEIVLYELLDRDLEELNSLKELCISWRDSSLKTVDVLKVHLDRTDKVADLFTKLLTPQYEKVIKLDGSRKLRLFSVYSFKFDKSFEPTDPISALPTFYGEGHGLIVEEIPQDEVDALAPEPKAGAEEPRVARVNHSCRLVDKSRYRGTFHSHPFLLFLRPKEKFADCKKRIQARLHLSDDKFSNLQFYLTGVTSEINDIADDAVLYDHKWEKGEFLVVDWPEGKTLNSTSPGATTASGKPRKSRGERAVEIKG